MTAMLGILLAFTVSTSAPNRVAESVDMIELNHFHDVLGRHVYDQVIFYEWSQSHREFHVRAWALIDERDSDTRWPTKNYASGRWHVRWHDRDQNIARNLSSAWLRESWTQADPERVNKSLLPEHLRHSLVKRLTKPATE